MTSAVEAGPANEAPHRLIDGVSLGEGVVVRSFVNLYGCRIGDRTHIGTFVEVERGASIGSGATILGGVRIGSGATVGAGALASGDVGAGATVAGNPARPLPRR